MVRERREIVVLLLIILAVRFLLKEMNSGRDAFGDTIAFIVRAVVRSGKNSGMKPMTESEIARQVLFYENEIAEKLVKSTCTSC